MKCIILSDTHGNFNLAVKAIEQAAPVDLIIHLGDEQRDADLLEHVLGMPIEKVPGNCDFASFSLRDKLKIIAGKRVFLTHGDCYNVKAGLNQLYGKAVRDQIDIVLFGHTHNAQIKEIDGKLFINPGTLHSQSSTKSFATLNIENETVSAEIFNMESI